jgi:hypothetical protein
MDASNQFLTETEVSQMTRIALQTLRNDRFKRHGIPYYKVGNGKSVRYKLIDVINFMESGRIETGSISENPTGAKGGRRF